MRVTTQREVIRTVLTRYRQAHGAVLDSPLAPEFRQVEQKLAALNLETATLKELEDILDPHLLPMVHLYCSDCGKPVERIATFNSRYEDDDCNLCVDCLTEAVEALKEA